MRCYPYTFIYTKSVGWVFPKTKKKKQTNRMFITRALSSSNFDIQRFIFLSTGMNIKSIRKCLFYNRTLLDQKLSKISVQSSLLMTFRNYHPLLFIFKTIKSDIKL